MRNNPQPGEFYNHFKNKKYQIINVATHSETREKLVIYQALYGDFGVYARPLEMFMSEVDHEKYPLVTQKYRFEKIELEPMQHVSPQIDSVESKVEPQQGLRVEQQQGLQQELQQKTEVMQADSFDSEFAPNPNLIRFLDADSYEEKYDVLVSMANEITDRLIDDMAVVLDLVIPEGELMHRYDQLKYAVRTKGKYEYSTRLR